MNTINAESEVRKRYAAGAAAPEAKLCCPVDYNTEYLKVIPQEVIDRDYGCGDPSPYVREGDIVLVSPWDFDHRRADIVWRYIKDHADWLETNGYMRPSGPLAKGTAAEQAAAAAATAQQAQQAATTSSSPQ